VKEESPLPNGLSAISIDGHPWPNSAASSSSVESLFQSISPTAETLSIPAKLEASSGSGKLLRLVRRCQHACVLPHCLGDMGRLLLARSLSSGKILRKEYSIFGIASSSNALKYFAN